MLSQMASLILDLYSSIHTPEAMEANDLIFIATLKAQIDELATIEVDVHAKCLAALADRCSAANIAPCGLLDLDQH